ncbi:MAG: MFS transporter [Elusimicrobiaceae bacterium]|nr:MFS transporter [Elusimicrobiaceae bacterium]
MTEFQKEPAACGAAQGFVFAGAKSVFALLFLINLFNYIDRQVLYAVFPLIKSDLGISDAALGLLASAFMLVYLAASPGIGYLADRGPRQKLIAASALLWSFATMAGAAVRNYGHLLFARSFIGIGEAGFTAISPSFVAEYFPAARRARVLALFTMALPMGSALGYLLGGKLGQAFGWRAAFMMVGVPGIILGVLAFALRDPRRQAGRAAQAGPDWRQYLEFFRNRPFMYACLSLAMSTFTLGGFAAWAPTFFTRYYGMSVGKAGLVFGIMTVLAGSAGTLLGGWAADWLHEKTDRAYFIITAAALLLSLPFLITGLAADSLPVALTALVIAEILVFVNIAPMNAAVVACTDLSVRSMAFALNVFIIHILGDAVSPTIIGILSDRFGLRCAMLACCVMLVAGSWFAVKGARSVESDGGA